MKILLCRAKTQKEYPNNDAFSQGYLHPNRIYLCINNKNTDLHYNLLSDRISQDNQKISSLLKERFEIVSE
jgi:hypothetical protein